MGKRGTRICIEDGCEAVIGVQGKTGMCRPCVIRRNFADPAYVARLRGGLARYYEQPGTREQHGARLAAGNARRRERMTPEERERERQHGRWLYQTHASRPEVRERSLSPEARAIAAAACSETRMGWCPPHLRADYHRMVRQKVPAEEARRIVEAEIPGTREYARREVASRELAMRMRDEKRRQDAY